MAVVWRLLRELRKIRRILVISNRGKESHKGKWRIRNTLGSRGDIDDHEIYTGEMKPVEGEETF